jgi:hypothetical protein
MLVLFALCLAICCFEYESLQIRGIICRFDVTLIPNSSMQVRLLLTNLSAPSLETPILRLRKYSFIPCNLACGRARAKNGMKY